MSPKDKELSQLEEDIIIAEQEQSESKWFNVIKGIVNSFLKKIDDLSVILLRIEKREPVKTIKVSNLNEIKPKEEIVITKIKEALRFEKPEWFKTYDDAELLKLIKEIAKKEISIKYEKFDDTDILEELEKIANKNTVAISPNVTEALNEIKKSIDTLYQSSPTHKQINDLMALITSGGTIYIDNETPSGDVDNVNKDFSTFYEYKPGTLKVYKNGIRQKEGIGNDYFEEGGKDFQFDTPPLTGTIIVVDYMKK